LWTSRGDAERSDTTPKGWQFSRQFQEGILPASTARPR
jgi:hypothetical protein